MRRIMAGQNLKDLPQNNFDFNFFVVNPLMKIEKPAKLVIDIFNCLRIIRNQKLYLLPERSAIKSYIYYQKYGRKVPR